MSQIPTYSSEQCIIAGVTLPIHFDRTNTNNKLHDIDNFTLVFAYVLIKNVICK